MQVTSLRHHSGIPQGVGVIDRPRLMERLRATADYRLILVCAPPGYGKTTVAAQFARQAPFPVAWCTIDHRDRDVPTLFLGCLASLEPVVPGIQSLRTSTGYSPSELAALLADYVRDRLADDIIFVLDDVQHLTGSIPAEMWLRTLVSLLPTNCHILIVSRTLPDLPLTQMIARREVLAIGQEELRFTPEEIEQLAHRVLGVSLSEADLHRLAIQLEGWPAGTVLAMYPLPADLERSILAGESGPEALFNALADLMLQNQPPGLRDFLLVSSVPGRFTPAFCSTVLQVTNSTYWLAEAQKRNLFISQMAGGLVYHRLFRTFLQRRLQVDDPDRFTHLHITVARHYEADDRLDEAFDHYLIVGALQEAAAIAGRVAQTYFTQGKVETLLDWGSELSQQDINPPELLLACAKVHTDRLEYAEAEADLLQAEAASRTRQDPMLLAEIQLQRAMIDLQRGEFQAVTVLIEPLLTLPEEPTNLRGRALRIVGVASLRQGDTGEAVRLLQEAVTLHRRRGDAYALANVLQDLGVAYSRLGQLADASACLQEVVALHRSLGSASTLALALNNLGYYYHRGGDYKQAMATFQEGLSVSSQGPNRRTEAYLLASMGDLQRDCGAYHEALHLYHNALELIGDTEPSLRAAILIGLSILWRWQGDYREATAQAQAALSLANAHNIALEGSLARAAVWVARGQQFADSATALTALESVVRELEQQRAQYDLIWVLTLCAHLAMLNADAARAEKYLGAALDQAVRLGSLQMLVAEVVHTPLLGTIARNSPRRYGRVLDGAKALQSMQAAASPLAPVDEVTYSLRVTALQWESIERDGEPIMPSMWRSTSARELFLYLLFGGPTSREQISLDFWPDSTPGRVRSNFHTTLYRARHALGENAIIFNEGLYQINPDLEVWCDVFEIEALVAQARNMSPRDARTENLWRKAVDLYQGEFLPSLYGDWVITRRESLHEAYLEALIGLGMCARARNDLRAAIMVFKSALAVDPYREDVYRAIMTSYADLGERWQILTYLRKLQEVFRDELGIDPSRETLALANSLLR